MAGIVSIYFPFHQTADVIYAVLGCFGFSSYTILDTHMIHQRVSPRDYIPAVLSLYVECVSTFQLCAYIDIDMVLKLYWNL